MNRVQIIGYGGAGKTTLAKEISNALDIPHCEVDGLFWLPNWQPKPQADFVRDLKKVTRSKKWVICGSYFNVSGAEISQQADVIIVLAYPLRTIIPRIIKRSIKRGITREKLWGNNRESLFNFLFHPKKSMLWFVLGRYVKQGRYKYRKRAVAHGFKRKIIMFKTPKDAQRWLQNI